MYSRALLTLCFSEKEIKINDNRNKERISIKYIERGNDDHPTNLDSLNAMKTYRNITLIGSKP